MIVVLLSGGIDSTVALHLAAAEGKKFDKPVVGFFVNYGQNNYIKEHDAAFAQTAFAGTHWFSYTLHDSPYRDHPMVQGSNDLDDSWVNAELRFRNPLLVSLAIANIDCGEVWTGIQPPLPQHVPYADTSSEFIDRMTELVDTATNGKVTLVTPFAEPEYRDKVDIILRGEELGVDWTHTWSCFRGDEKPCGKCVTCQQRHRAFLGAGVEAG